MLGRNAGLQIGRGIACIAVVLGHAAYMAGALSGDGASTWFTQNTGPFGVNLFFVLSGYVMGLILRQERRPDALTFLYHRALRIYPPYWVAALLFCAISYYLLNRVVPPFDATALLLSPSFLGSYYGVPAWTLVYEVVFYLLILLAILTGATLWQTTALALIWATVIVVVDIVFGQLYFHVQPEGYILISALNLFFIVGLLLAVHNIRLASVPTWVIVMAAGALWMIGALFEPTMRRLPPTIFQAASCALFVLVFARIKPKNSYKLAVSIGNASYGIYLIHMTMMDMLFTLANMYEFKPSVSTAFIIFTAVSIPCGWLFGTSEFSAYRLITAGMTRTTTRLNSKPQP